MCYDYHGGWETKTGHNAPLFARPEESGMDSLSNVVSFFLLLHHHQKSDKLFQVQRSNFLPSIFTRLLQTLPLEELFN